jgi:hypothetical protein
MEILISTLIGWALMEAHAWLDPLAKWLVRRAAQQLPEGNREEFTEQFMADVAALPNSIFKVVFAFRNCTLAIKDIEQAILRDTFDSVADGCQEYLNSLNGRIDELLKRSTSLLQRSETSATKFKKALDNGMQHLRQQKQDAAIERLVVVGQPATEKLFEYHAQLKEYHAFVSKFAVDLRDAVAGVADVGAQMKKRLDDERPLDDDDLGLLQLVDDRVETLASLIDAYREDASGLSINCPVDLLPAVRSAAEELETALKAAKALRAP